MGMEYLLVDGFKHLEKILVNGKDYPIYIMEQLKMFQTTNQNIFTLLGHGWWLGKGGRIGADNSSV